MFKRLQEKWGVSTRQFWIIFIAFGLTGTTTAFITRYVAAWLGLGPDSFWLWKLLLRVGMLLLGYQVLLLGYGALLGQWAFFWKYEQKLLQKLGVLPKKIHKVAIFASGAGSNTAKIIAHFKNHSSIKIVLIVCNKPAAGVLQIAAENGISTLMIEIDRFANGDGYCPELLEKGINFVVLAGFLWKMPQTLISAFPNQIINIHPALLPKHGGKGMYGAKVHETVIAAEEKESGITIHYVNEHYDQGATIFQATCSIYHGEDAISLAHKIHDLEHQHYPLVIERLLSK